jgi:hypothetical protein
MTDLLAASIIDLVLGVQLGAAGQDASNRFSLEGVTSGSTVDGVLELRIHKLEAASLRLASGPFTVEIGHLALHQLIGQVRIDAGRPRLRSLEAAGAELSDVKVHGPLAFSRDDPAAQAAAGTWSLGPFAAANGTIRAEILDAHLLFDADVTVPIREGKVNFNDATVEHVGPDSRMGISHLGLYVDAPNGRSYLYQFPAAPVAGVAYERRGPLLGALVMDRGHLQLQPFGEALLRQGRGGPGAGLTEQARLLFERTALSGDLRLGDGRLAAAGLQVDLVGREQGRNTIGLHSEAVGRGLSADIASLSARNAAWHAKDIQLGCDEITGVLVLALFVEGGQFRFALTLSKMTISGLSLRRQPSPPRP